MEAIGLDSFTQIDWIASLQHGRRQQLCPNYDGLTSTDTRGLRFWGQSYNRLAGGRWNGSVYGRTHRVLARSMLGIPCLPLTNFSRRRLLG